MTDSYGKSSTATRTIFVTFDGKAPKTNNQPSTTENQPENQSQVTSAASSPSTSNFELSTLSTSLSRGSTGSEVTKLQTFLISQNLLTPSQATGYFGPATEKAVRTFQINQQIPNDPGSSVPYGSGFVGQRTLARINQLITQNLQLTTGNGGASSPSVSSPVPPLGTLNLSLGTSSSTPTLTRDQLIASLKAQIIAIQQQLVVLLQELVRVRMGEGVTN